MQRLTPFVGQLLPVADGIELGQVVFVARGVFVADSFLVLVQSVEIFSEVPTPCRCYFSRQIFDTLLDRAVFFLISCFLAIAEESASLCQMIKRPAKQPALCAIPEIEPLGQGYITIVVRISIPIVVGSLPTEEFIVLRVTFLFLPGGQQLLGQRRAKVVTDEYFEQFDFSQTPPEIVAAQCPGARPILNGRFFIVFVAGNSLLENVYTFVNQRIFVLLFIDKGPSQ